MMTSMVLWDKCDSAENIRGLLCGWSSSPHTRWCVWESGSREICGIKSDDSVLNNNCLRLTLPQVMFQPVKLLVERWRSAFRHCWSDRGRVETQTCTHNWNVDWSTDGSRCTGTTGRGCGGKSKGCGSLFPGSSFHTHVPDTLEPFPANAANYQSHFHPNYCQTAGCKLWPETFVGNEQQPSEIISDGLEDVWTWWSSVLVC